MVVAGSTEVDPSGRRTTNLPGRLGGWCYDHRRAVLIAWILGVIAVIATAGGLGPAFQDNFGGVACPDSNTTRALSPACAENRSSRMSRACCDWPLVALAVPMFSMRLAFSDSGNDPTRLTTRQAYDLLAHAYGPGFNGPLVLAAELPRAAGDHGVLDGFTQRLAGVPGVSKVTAAIYNPAGDAAVMVIYPAADPQSAETAALVDNLRDNVIPEALAGTDVRVLVGGRTAAGIDESARLSVRLPWVIGLVILLSFVLLMVVFRSIAIPLKAAAMNLLSIGAAYGAIVAVYQWGWLSSIFGVTRTGPIDPWIPLMMFTITFGLSMDYEVFLLSRIQEEWRRHRDNSAAVAHGIAATGRIITAAAAIMVCVYGSFVIGDPLRTLNIFGLGPAVAILVDATLVRMVLAPSIMQLLGRANWWLPAGLDRILPRIEIEE